MCCGELCALVVLLLNLCWLSTSLRKVSLRNQLLCSQEWQTLQLNGSQKSHVMLRLCMWQLLWGSSFYRVLWQLSSASGDWWSGSSFSRFRDRDLEAKTHSRVHKYFPTSSFSLSVTSLYLIKGHTLRWTFLCHWSSQHKRRLILKTCKQLKDLSYNSRVEIPS